MDAITYDLLDYDQYFFYLGNNAGKQAHYMIVQFQFFTEIEEMENKEIIGILQYNKVKKNLKVNHD